MTSLHIAASVTSLALAGYHFCTTGAVMENPYGTPNLDNSITLYALDNDGFSSLKEVQLSKQDLAFDHIFPSNADGSLAQLREEMESYGYDFDGKMTVEVLPVVKVNGAFLVDASIKDVWAELNYY